MAVTNYVTPQVLVYQEFTQTPVGATESLRALIAGPQAYLARYGTADEKPNALAGAYDPLAGNAFPWPHRPAGAVVDVPYVKVFVDDAELVFFQELIGGGRTVAPVDGAADRVTISGSAGWAQNGTALRLAALGDRDVQPGDRIRLRGVVASTNYTLETYVSRVASDPVAAVTGPATADADNWGTQAAAKTISQTGGTSNSATLTGDITGYSAYPTGDLVETYTVAVTQSSVGGDLTTGQLRVTSASGRDDDLVVTPAASGTAFPVGGRGLMLTLTRTAPDNIVVGQQWQVVVTDNYAALAGTSGGTYAGGASTTYVFECTRGGNFADPDPDLRPQMRAYTTTGVDGANPITLNAVGTAYPVGTQGVTFTFAGTPAGIAKGDRFYVAVTAAGAGRMSTLVLGHNLPPALTTATDLDITLYATRDIQVPQFAGPYADNWTPQEQQIVLAPAITTTDPAFTAGGVPMVLPVTAGTVYVEYRAWVDDQVGEVGTISDVGDIDAMLSGPLHPDNPLKWGVYKALANANGTQVKFAGVLHPDDLDDWTAMLGTLTTRDDVYNIVPLTQDRAVQDLVAAHCNDESSPEYKAWRTCFVNIKAKESMATLDQSTAPDGKVVLARVADDPAQTDNQYVLLTVTSGNGAFVANNVRPGDTLRTGFGVDDAGDPTWTEYVIDSVRNEDTLLLVAGPASPIVVPQKIEVWHTLTKAEVAADLATQAGSFGSRRVKAVWPDQVAAAGTTMPGYFLCCALAGLRSGVAPHQGLTNVQLAGFDDLSRTTKFLGAAQLDTMAAAGVWIVTQASDGTVFTRHALTTDRSSVETSEEMVTTNLDSISYQYATLLAPYIGQMNVTDNAILILRTEIDAVIGFLKSSITLDRLGPQVIDAQIVDIRRHAFLADRVVAIVNHTLPVPVNNLELHVVV